MEGNDIVFSHPKINEIILLLKDYGVLEYHKTIMEIYFEGRIRKQIKIREILNSNEASAELAALSNVLGKLLKPLYNKISKKIKDEKIASAVPFLSTRKIFKN